MLFNSFAFLLVFLPLSLLGYHLALKLGNTASMAWLALCSLAFYGYWDVRYLPLILVSILFNYYAGRLLSPARALPARDLVFGLSILVNIAVLVVFKYLGALSGALADVGLLTQGQVIHLMLPLGISFFTFTQIAYLVDQRVGLAEDLGLITYTVFVTFFPHLIAGPILHIREIGPQLTDRLRRTLTAERIAAGLLLFTMGMVKKTWIADPLAPVVETGYGHVDLLSGPAAWVVIFAYSLQLYFDFSGYSDMAIGLAELFGIEFPVNFNSPYKARGAIDFWQRWHMTLSRYLTLLLYSPIAMWVTRRRASAGLPISARAVKEPLAFLQMIVFPTAVTMTIAGVWHGAGLQYLVFGLCHAFLLIANHFWRTYFPPPKRAKPVAAKPSRFTPALEVLATFLAVSLTFVFFRARSFADALTVLGVAFHAPGLFTVPAIPEALTDTGFTVDRALLLRLLACAVAVWALPNSQQVLARFRKRGGDGLQWLIGNRVGMLLGGSATGVALLACAIRFGHKSEFLYFQF